MNHGGGSQWPRQIGRQRPPPLVRRQNACRHYRCRTGALQATLAGVDQDSGSSGRRGQGAGGCDGTLSLAWIPRKSGVFRDGTPIVRGGRRGCQSQPPTPIGTRRCRLPCSRPARTFTARNRWGWTSASSKRSVKRSGRRSGSSSSERNTVPEFHRLCQVAAGDDLPGGDGDSVRRHQPVGKHRSADGTRNPMGPASGEDRQRPRSGQDARPAVPREMEGLVTIMSAAAIIMVTRVNVRSDSRERDLSMKRIQRVVGDLFLAAGMVRAVFVAVPVAGADETVLRSNETATSLILSDGTRTVLDYRYGEVPFKPYAAQLTTPGGTQILRDSPFDHKHHHGLMFALAADGVNFWEETPASGRQAHREFNGFGVSTRDRRGHGRFRRATGVDRAAARSCAARIPQTQVLSNSGARRHVVDLVHTIGTRRRQSGSETGRCDLLWPGDAVLGVDGQGRPNALGRRERQRSRTQRHAPHTLRMVCATRPRPTASR